MLSCSLAPAAGVGVAWGAGGFLKRGENRGRPGLGRRGGLGGFLTPSVVPSTADMHSTLLLLLPLCFALSSSEVAVRLFGLFRSYCSYFAPTAHACSYF